MKDYDKRKGTRPTPPDDPILRPPVVEDGPALWRLARDTGLDANSLYAYLMTVRFFGDTCVVAEHEGEVVGFVTAFHPPRQPDTVFVWQIGVAERMRGRGLASAVLLALLRLPACQDTRYLEATVTPSNRASFSLFRSLADAVEAEFKESPCFPAELFEGGHEPEMLLRIGPFRPLV